jgi:hypothetical protein
VERRLNDDRSDYLGPIAICRCGQHARFVRHRWKSFRSALGEIKLRRAYYYCSACGHGFCPRDEQLGLAGTSLSPGVTRMVALVGATVSFEEGSELLAQLAGLAVDAKLVEREAETIGAAIATDERELVQEESSRPVTATMYCGLDGTGVPVRASEVEGRAGKQPDGSAKTREVKLCAMWTAESRDKDGIPTRDPGSVTYTAAIESAAMRDTDDELSEVAQRVMRETHRRRFLQAKRRVVLGDGAAFIWNIFDELFPGAIQILDRFHAKEHLIAVAKVIWPVDDENRHRWLTARMEELDAGKVEILADRLMVHASRYDDARACADYFLHNRHRMRYGAFHAAGLCTSTGVLEAGCKHAIGTRLKRPGMHWTVRGANAIAALRCSKLSNRLEPFLQRRSHLKVAA